MFFKFIVNFLARMMSKSHYVQKVGIWAYEDSYSQTFGSSSVKLFMESYFDLVICVMVNLLALIQTNNIKSFYETKLDAACSTICIIFAMLFFVYPIWGAIKIYKNQGSL